MQQPKNSDPTFPVDGGGCRPPGETHVETQRSVDPNISIEDYNRVMLQYTQRRMSSFLDMGNDSGPPSRSSRSSDSSGNSGVSTSGVLARQAAGPTSLEASHHRNSQTPGHKPVKHAGDPKTGL
ncbi:hypothetical protein IFM51744_05981 [Aspergillus udagawae]|jgi:hypothetical protein|uniref:Uncharacterized protein n=2 Tax=Aspergillus udagawae TaxID=91492 RepID=A0A8E0V1K4_9EURO|nr:uncharacterized protein Aud_006485 [Aspergillus udagawae]GFF45102.1 hypothetical protein IFM51744_05981 [Aspergillus udagawae]GFF45754.1 hypothetical protein IFM46972_07875 [Aspergillus udagawae]GFG13875.1 hypothetical protein IFM5058_06669 [Aspergillus udagawae]GIC90055.1 hypothetical protein Aud_006485 [Aspergillus udagawae]